MSGTKTDFDLVVIGGGSGGYACARTAVDEGLKVAVIEGGDTVGGLCILRGCMPSKALIESANRCLTLRRAEEFGLRAGEIEVRPDEIVARKNRLIQEFASYRQEQLANGAFEFLRGRACFVDGTTVRVTMLDGSDRMVTARSFVISTGSVISKVPVPGLEEVGYFTSDSALDATRIPPTLVVLGGGAISLEMAHYFAALGSEVTIIQRSPHVLKQNDPDLTDMLCDALRSRGIDIFTDTSLLRVEATATGKKVVFRHGDQEREIEATEILQSLGRHPNTDSLILDGAGVARDGRRVRTNAFQQTSAPHIFAAGDVCGPHEIVHVAIEQGEIAARNATRVLEGTGCDLEKIDYRLLLAVVFSEPQFAVVGLGEMQAKKAELPYVTASYPFDDHGKSMTMGETHGCVKLIAHKETGEILGGGVVGPHASDLIHEIVVAMHYHGTVGELARIPHYHPTLSEIWTYPAEELAEKVGSVPDA